MIRTKEVVTYLSDVSGNHVDAVESVVIKRGGKFYVIDVDKAHADEELGQITVAEAITRARVEPASMHSGRNRRAELHAQARAFALGKGLNVGTRGSVSDEIVEDFRQAEQQARDDERERSRRSRRSRSARRKDAADDAQGAVQDTAESTTEDVVDGTADDATSDAVDDTVDNAFNEAAENTPDDVRNRDVVDN